MKNNKNYQIVTDGIKNYRLNRRYKIPKGLKEVFYIKDKKIYNSDGELLSKYMKIQEIEPRNNPNILARSINHAINSGQFHGNKINHNQ